MSRRLFEASGTSAIIVAIGSVALCTVLFSKVSARYETRQTVPDGATIKQPDTWIPFTVDYSDTKTNSVGDVVLVTTEYRSATGSKRYDQFGGPHGYSVGIDNLRTSRHYDYKGNKWISHPLREQAEGGKPFGVLNRSTVTPVAATDQRLEAFVNVGIPLAFYELTSGGNASNGTPGNTVVFCPELNLLMAWMHLGHMRIVRQVNWIVMGEPAISFEPPPNAVVEQNSNPVGAGKGSPRGQIKPAEHQAEKH